MQKKKEAVKIVDTLKKLVLFFTVLFIMKGTSHYEREIVVTRKKNVPMDMLLVQPIIS